MIEWEDYVTDLAVEVLARQVATEELRPETRITTPYVLVLSSGGGGALATGGTKAQLLALAERVWRMVSRLPGPPPTGPPRLDLDTALDGLRQALVMPEVRQAIVDGVAELHAELADVLGDVRVLLDHPDPARRDTARAALRRRLGSPEPAR